MFKTRLKSKTVCVSGLQFTEIVEYDDLSDHNHWTSHGNIIFLKNIFYSSIGWRCPRNRRIDGRRKSLIILRGKVVTRRTYVR